MTVADAGPGGLFSLDGRVALVAGASRGIGFVLAQGLAGAGATVVGCGRSAAPQDARTTSFEYLRCDLADEAQVAAMFAEVRRRHGAPDVYVHVAAVTLPSGAGLQSAQVFEQTLQLNLVAAYRCCATAGAAMAEAGGGSIIGVTSINALQAFPDNPGYVAAKGGMRMMCKALALDLGPRGVRVNCLVPGYIRTDMTARSHADPKLREQRSRRTMLGRWGEAAELVGATVFLASRASSYVTGSDLVVDGGWTAKGL